jgi:U3 small nucleolar RNA-associated protein 13
MWLLARQSRDASAIAVVYSDQNIVLYDLETAELTRQIIGYNDEVIDTIFLSSTPGADTHLAVASNSSQIRLYTLESLDVRLLHGHSDIVLCLSSGARGLVLGSGAKDNTARIWHQDTSTELAEASWTQHAVCEGHAESVGSIAFPKKAQTLSELLYVFTGSQDRSIKMWDLSSVSQQSQKKTRKLHTLTSVVAHEKDINALDVSPDDELLASGSQDKTAKIFKIVFSSTSKGSTGELKHLGTCKGHKRGVWDVKFSPSERLLATASGDKTIKLWNLADFTCVKVSRQTPPSRLPMPFLDTRGPYKFSPAAKLHQPRVTHCLCRIRWARQIMGFAGR